MQFNREITRLTLGFILAFALVALAAAYWAVIGPTSIVNREDNPRRVLAQTAIQRGAIIDRDGETLAETVPNEDGFLERRYEHRETFGTIGYYSLRYGASGPEAAYDNLLSGAANPGDFWTQISRDLFHRSQVGTDIQLTFDLDVQRAADEALSNRPGAIVVLDVPSGQVLALVSRPTYDPHRLDSLWDIMNADPGRPFFNRAIQGRYQPGGTLQTPLMALALIANAPLQQPIEHASEPVEVGDTTVSCAVRLPDTALMLSEAYAFACPGPFIGFGQQQGPRAVQSTFETFRLGQAPLIEGLTVAPEATPEPSVLASLTLNNENLTANIVGQGDLTITPLSMAIMAAAIVNDGNAPQAYTLLAVRDPLTEAWIPDQTLRPTTPFATINTARQLQDFMRDAVANGAAQNAGRPNIDIGGQATTAISGDTLQSWFIGFATLQDRRGLAIAVVLEDSGDPGLAADIGGRVLEAAHRADQP